MSIDSTEITLSETKITTALTTDQATSIRDAAGNEIQYYRPTLTQQADFYDWLQKTSKKSGRTSMFDKFKFAERG